MRRFPSNSIVLNTPGGLANRLLALEGALMLGEQIDKRVYWPWRNSWNAGCHYTDLFEQPEHFELLPSFKRHRCPAVIKRGTHLFVDGDKRANWGKKLDKLWQQTGFRYIEGFDAVIDPYLEWRIRIGQRTYTRIGRDLNVEDLRPCRRIFLSAWYNFMLDDEGVLVHLQPSLLEKNNIVRPVTELRERIEEWATKFAGKRTVGVHVRRGDFLSFPGRVERSPTAEFVRLIREEIAKDDGVCFYLATDSHEEYDHLKQLFGERLMSQRDSGKPLDGRGNVNGMQEAVVDLFVLARTDRVLRTYHSSFGMLAAKMGGIKDAPLVDVPLAKKT